MEPTLEEEVRTVINRRSLENDSGTPDYVLASFLIDCLAAFNRAVKAREQFYNSATVSPATARGGPLKAAQEQE